jgi:hypothetical protein
LRKNDSRGTSFWGGGRSVEQRNISQVGFESFTVVTDYEDYCLSFLGYLRIKVLPNVYTFSGLSPPKFLVELSVCCE